MKTNETNTLTKLLILSVFTLLANILDAQTNRNVISREDYIERYKPVVMQKMRDFGIPASIAMAQAIVESGNGNSALAQQANNHFGIKCHDWTGQTFRWDDDEKNECFRKYASAEESFHDHSLFLSLRPRYSGLFELDVADYKAWAHGLKKAGYATNPHYAQMLIRIIEENSLYEIDREVLFGPVLADKTKVIFDDHVFATAAFIEFGPGPNHRTLFLNNRRLFVYARPGDTYFSIANDFDIHLAKLFRLNDVEIGSHLKEGAMVFIEPKRRRSADRFHRVQENETMHDISQHYGVRLQSLYRRNNLPEGALIRPGDQIRLR